MTSRNEKLQFEDLNVGKFEEAFKSLKRNKAAAFAYLSSKIIIDAYDSLKYIPFHIFKVSIQYEIFPDSPKIAKVTPIIEFIYSVLYEKQFGFQGNNSTEHAILHLTRDITGCFEKGKYTLGVYTDFFKAFVLKCFTIKYFQYSVFLYFKSFCISQYFYPQNKNQICPPK